MKKRSRPVALWMTAALACLLAVALPGYGASGSTEGSREVTDPDRVLVDDLEDPGDVVARSEAALGDRFVDVSISGDHSTYIVGVLDLKDGEGDSLAAQIQYKAPVTIQDRSVPRDETEQAREQVEKEIIESGIPFTLISSNLAEGIVNVGVVAQDDVDAVARLLMGALPGRVASEASDGGLFIEAADRSASQPVIWVRVLAGEGAFTETMTEAPYRAGKRVAIGGTTNNCTTSWLFKKNQKNFGATTGHCGPNGDHVYFAGDRKGDVQWNQFYADTPILADVLLYDLGNGGTKTLYRSSTLNRDVTGKYGITDMVVNWRTCTRGAWTDDQSCGDLLNDYIDATIQVDGYTIKNQYCWDWETANATIPGDSGAPVYRVRANESVWAAGINSSRRDTNNNGVWDAACFTGIVQVLNQLGANLQTQ